MREKQDFGAASPRLQGLQGWWAACAAARAGALCGLGLLAATAVAGAVPPPAPGSGAPVERGPGASGEDIEVAPGTSGEIDIAPEGGGEIDIAPGPEGGASDITVEGAGPGPEAPAAPPARSWSLRLPAVRLEAGGFTGSPRADGLGFGRLVVRSEGRGAGWEARIEALADLQAQGGPQGVREARLDYGETYLRLQRGAWRLTLGTQTLIWGRLDEIPLADRLSRVDATRGLLDDLPERRRALPALRVERFLGEDKLDLVVLPHFRAAALPDRDSVWYPVHRSSGEILGIDLPASVRALVRNAGIDEDGPADFHGVGLRYTHVQGALDLGVTLERTRRSLPYFRLDPPRSRLVAEYPRSTLAGFDLGFDSGRAVWRWEMAWLSDVPVTRTSGAYDRVRGLQWGGAVEFHPGDGDLRVNLQLVGQHLLDAGDVFDRTHSLDFNGSLSLPFAGDRWRLDVRWFTDLDRRNLYLNPTLAWTGLEAGEVTLSWHAFSGEAGTLGGFYRQADLVTLGWHAAF
ncbi:MAG: hypothetical protein D6721_01700 [Gammaproteobacteria bacterium]|nr:MAG: hypothetical protein D6721_01700 [Gammaproteobacteria bacterium]